MLNSINIVNHCGQLLGFVVSEMFGFSADLYLSAPSLFIFIEIDAAKPRRVQRSGFIDVVLSPGCRSKIAPPIV